MLQENCHLPTFDSLFEVPRKLPSTNLWLPIWSIKKIAIYQPLTPYLRYQLSLSRKTFVKVLLRFVWWRPHQKELSPMNEGHSILLWGTSLHIVEKLNDLPKMYRFSIYPVRKEERDRRESKRSDFMIFKIKNWVTSVIVGVKLNVSDTLNFEMRDDLAQLFPEAEYADKPEGGWHKNTVCALTNMAWLGTFSLSTCMPSLCSLSHM